MGRGLFDDERGQVSAELIIVIAALLAVAMIFVTSLTSTVDKASDEMAKKSDSVIKKISEI